MFKDFLGLIACLSISLTTSAQWTIIPKAGVTVSDASIAHLDTKSKVGWTIGTAFNFQLNQTLSFQAELQYIQKGYSTEQETVVIDFKQSVRSKSRVGYIEMPLLVKATFGTGSVKFSLGGGPSVGYGLGGVLKVVDAVTFSDITVSTTRQSEIRFRKNPPVYSEQPYIDYDNRIDLGLQLGGGFIIRNKLILEARYGHGLSDFMRMQSKNRVVQIVVGYAFPMK